jgi:hypothetical protein
MVPETTLPIMPFVAPDEKRRHAQTIRSVFIFFTFTARPPR